MINTRQTARRLTFGMPFYSLFVVLYLVLIFVLPIAHNHSQVYNLTNFNYRVLLFIIALPQLIIWLAAFMSYNMLDAYAESIYKTPEGKHYKRLALGCAWLAWSLPITNIAGLILFSLGFEWHGFRPSSVILSNYIDIAIPLIGFTIINEAARGLFSNAKLGYDLVGTRLLALLFVVLGVVYCFLTFRHFDLSSLGSTHNPYYLPIWLMVLTVAIPYLYAWFVGMLAAYELTLFGRETRGVFYRQALRLMVIGLVTVIGSLIVRQYLNTAIPRLGYLALDYKLGFMLLLRVLTGVGFAIMAVGAYKLKKIEEI